MTEAKLYTDGGARGNPGPAGIGVVLNIGDEIYNYKKYIGKATNNQAEYQAIIFGLEKAIENKVMEIDCLLDSELVVKQLNREYKVKNIDLATLFIKVYNLSQKFKKISFSHIRRELNKQADKLVNQAIDEAIGK